MYIYKHKRLEYIYIDLFDVERETYGVVCKANLGVEMGEK